MQDIIVTARKRQESVQDVPVAVIALSPQTIRQQDLTSIEKVAARTPDFMAIRADQLGFATLPRAVVLHISTHVLPLEWWPSTPLNPI